MSIIAVAVKHLISAGVTGDALVTAIAEMEEAISSGKNEVKSSAAIRQQRYRERNALRNVTSRDVTQKGSPPDSPPDGFPSTPSLTPPLTPPTQNQKELPSGSSKKNGSRFALTHPPEEWIAFCRKHRSDLDPQTSFEGFRDYWLAVPGSKGCKLDWFATWRNWVRNEKPQRRYSTSWQSPPVPPPRKPRAQIGYDEQGNIIKFIIQDDGSRKLLHSEDGYA